MTTVYLKNWCSSRYAGGTQSDHSLDVEELSLLDLYPYSDPIHGDNKDNNVGAPTPANTRNSVDARFSKAETMNLTGNNRPIAMALQSAPPIVAPKQISKPNRTPRHGP